MRLATHSSHSSILDKWGSNFDRVLEDVMDGVVDGVNHNGADRSVRKEIRDRNQDQPQRLVGNDDEDNGIPTESESTPSAKGVARTMLQMPQALNALTLDNSS